MAVKQLHIIVRGRVQGVFFRAHTEEKARRLNLTGWVRNRPDGGVEITAEGETADLKSLEEWCRKGPPHAVVTDVSAAYDKAKGEFDSFRIKYF